MCGIAGIFGHDDPDGIAHMTGALAHRGPDDEDTLSLPDVAASLGHRRLAIVGLGRTGRQPMQTPDGRYCIVFNGEIYNYRALRDELAGQGAAFNGHSDTEVLLEALRHWGLDALPRLRGMFAFACVDRGARYGSGASFGAREDGRPALLLARDRLGIKPLVYLRDGKRLYFASELRALRANPDVPATLDPAAVADVLAFGAVRQPRTILRGVCQLSPGTAMVVRPGGLEHTHRFWDPFEASQALRTSLSRCDAQEQVDGLRRCLADATRAHLTSDVEVGAFLSGGLDSAAVTALMAAQAGAPPKTFTLAFEGSGGAGDGPVADERAAAARVARHLGCDHHELVVPVASVADGFGAIVEALDQPSVDGANTFVVSRLAAQHVKVALTGLGGDELFAGYPHFSDVARRPVATPLGAAAGALHWAFPSRLTYRWLAGHGEDAARLSLARSRRSGLRLRAMLAPAMWGAVPLASPDPLARTVTATYPRADPVALMSLYEMNGYLRSTLLRDVDVMSMAHGLEVRPVLLDHELVEYALALPAAAKLAPDAAGTRAEPHLGKVALRHAVRDLLPADLSGPRRKQGFELPYASWLNGPLRERVLWSSARPDLRRVLSRAVLIDLQGRARTRSLARRHWGPFVLAHWLLDSGLL